MRGSHHLVSSCRCYYRSNDCKATTVQLNARALSFALFAMFMPSSPPLQVASIGWVHIIAYPTTVTDICDTNHVVADQKLTHKPPPPCTVLDVYSIVLFIYFDAPI